MKYLQQIPKDTFKDRAFGCILGAFTADSCGSFREFSEMATDEEMDHVMTMPGNGPFNEGAGQITDDSEMAMCIMWAIVESNDGRPDNQER